MLLRLELNAVEGAERTGDFNFAIEPEPESPPPAIVIGRLQMFFSGIDNTKLGYNSSGTSVKFVVGILYSARKVRALRSVFMEDVRLVLEFFMSCESRFKFDETFVSIDFKINGLQKAEVYKKNCIKILKNKKHFLIRNKSLKIVLFQQIV